MNRLIYLCTGIIFLITLTSCSNIGEHVAMGACEEQVQDSILCSDAYYRQQAMDTGDTTWCAFLERANTGTCALDAVHAYVERTKDTMKCQDIPVEELRVRCVELVTESVDMEPVLSRVEIPDRWTVNTEFYSGIVRAKNPNLCGLFEEPANWECYISFLEADQELPKYVLDMCADYDASMSQVFEPLSRWHFCSMRRK